MPQLSQRFGFDLANAFSSNRKQNTHFLKGMLAATIEAKTPV